MKPFLIPVGRAAGASLATVLSALSCGAALPVSGLDILHISDIDPDPVLPSLIHDLNQAHDLLSENGNDALFPSSFVFDSIRPVLPSVRSLSESAPSAALLAALRGKGVPLSYKTDREAVEWAFSSLLSSEADSLAPLFSWFGRIPHADKEGRLVLLCDLCDPFSAGIAFSLLRFIHEKFSLPASMVSLFCLAHRCCPPAEEETGILSASLRSMDSNHLISSPSAAGSGCADTAWLISMPASLSSKEDSLRIMYVALARRLSSFINAEKLPAPGLHTTELPGVITFHALDDCAASFASFLHTCFWLLSDLLPALSSFFDHQSALRSLAPNTRNGLFKRLFRASRSEAEKPDSLPLLNRVFRAVLSEILNIIRFMPDQLRLAEITDSLWKKVTEACGRTVTVAAEYEVSVSEAREAGIMDIKPVHRVSMNDTEEEKQLRRLDEMASQLKDEIGLRDQVFSEIGGSGTLAALQDCRIKCEEALKRAEETAAVLAADPAADHLSEAACARRIRLLKAAVENCDQVLADPEFLKRLSGSLLSSGLQVSPFSNQLISDEAAEKLAALLTADDESSETVRRELRTIQPNLFYGFTLSDNKSLLRMLLSSCKTNQHCPPLITLLRSVHEISRDEVASLRFHTAGMAPPVPLLPDLYPPRPPVKISDLFPLLEGNTDHPDTENEKRGIMALFFLRQYRRRTGGDAVISSENYNSEDSPVLHAWLSGQNSGRVSILSLDNGDCSLPFALILPDREFIPARLTPAHFDLLPSFAAPWADPDNRTMIDPCPYLSEGDREILLERIEMILNRLSPSSGLAGFLKSFRQDLNRCKDNESIPEKLPLLLKAAFGLRMLPAFSGTLVQTVCYYEHFLPDDRIVSLLTGQESVPAFSCNIPEDIIYLYRNVPFARENSRALLESIPLPAQSWILNLLEQDCKTLADGSDLYHDALVRELTLLLERYPEALPNARQTALELIEKAQQPVTDAVTELTWPWDPTSPAVRTILSESLGETLSVYALKPFSDCLALFPARGSEVIGDAILSAMCLLPPASIPSEGEDTPAIQADAVLPPLSADLSAALCRLPEGRVLIRSGLLVFSRTDSGNICVTLTLDGRFPVHMIRNYTEDEILNLYSHDIPTLAVWPNLPFQREDWKAYYTYASLPEHFTLKAVDADGNEFHCSENGRNVSCTEAFPLSFTFCHESRSIGSLPNLLPSPEIKKSDDAVACVDFGSVGTAVVLSAGHLRRPLQGPTMVRTLLNNPASSRDLLRKEFLPAVPVSALLPTASRIFRNVPGQDPLPFEDGIVLMAADLQDVLSIPSDTLYTCLKWEEEKGRSVSLCLHQIMLMTALQARSDGASSLVWRFAVPDEMARDGRQRLLDLFASLADKVAAVSGFAAPEKTPVVVFAAESSALGAYFRFCSSEDTRGGFMILDIGACTADISLFLRGRDQAVRTCQIPLGIHYMLLPELLRDPSLLTRDLGFVQDPFFLQDLSLLERILNDARSDSSALRKARLALDSFIADRRPVLLPALLYNPLNGMPGRTGALLLLYFSYLMMLSGLILLQIAADPGKNDFLPEQMSLCLSGRGSILLEDMPNQIKSGLWHFLTMFRNRRVSSLSLLFSSEKKMEMAVGLSVLENVSTDLPPASAVPAAVSVRPEELLPQFLLKFRKEFPASAELLFSGFFTNDFYHPFTPRGESFISSAISQSFTEQTALRPFDSLSGWIGTLLEMVSSSA